MRISRQDIRSAIGEPTFSRGAAYYAGGKVRDVAMPSAGHVTGAVKGSGARPYQVEARVVFSPGGSYVVMAGHCTCPVGMDCKHVAALLLAAQGFDMTGAAVAAGPAPPAPPAVARPKAPAKAVDPPMPVLVRHWLEQWQSADAQPKAGQRAASGAATKLYYVFQSRQRGEAVIVPYKAKAKKDGSIGANAREFTGSSLAHAPAFATAEDAGILARLSFFSTGSWPARFAWPDGATTRTFLQEIVATGRARALDIRGAALAWGPPRHISLTWAATADGEQQIVAADASGAPINLLPFPDLVYIDAAAGLIGMAETGLPPGAAARLAAAPPVPAEAASAVAEAMLCLGAAIPRPHHVAIEERTGLQPKPRLRLFGQDIKQHALPRYAYQYGRDLPPMTYPCGQIHVAYDGAADALRPGEGPDVRLTENGALMVIRRDFDREARIVGRIEDIAEPYGGLSPDLIDLPRSAPKQIRAADLIFPPTFPGDDPIDAPGFAFAVEALPKLRAEGWEIEIDPSWPFRLHDGPTTIRAAIEPSGTDWFAVALTLDAGGQTLDLTAIVLHIIEVLPVDDWGNLEAGFDVEEFLADQTYYPQLADGARVSVPGELLAPLVAAFLEAQGLVGFHRAEAGRAAALAEALDGCGVAWSGGAEILELGKRLRRLSETQDQAPPPQLKAELRPYQRTGYGWLRALTDCGFGGVLADDMGLGKTIQALALLAHRHLEAGADRPSLLIVPTSLLGNWQREAARFAPDLKLLRLHGPNRRDRFAEIPDHHVIMTTYPLVNRDHEDLFAQRYDLAILDEAQAVKNPAAAIAKHIRQIDARQRIALTGTPMENNLQELWALYDWLIPGLLGDRKGFTATYRKPIEQLGDRSQQRLLSTRIKPFLMRRTKAEVASDLPPKTVIDEFVPLDGGQAALYESIRAVMDARVRDAIAKKGLAGSRITILDALLKLRQACNDPALVKLDAARKVTDSAKRARLLEMLEELRAEGRKVLIFSQFVEMLRLIEADLTARNWDYAILHGQTKDREAAIEKFQSGDAQLFLISLKAGGVGLNLTAADTVILYDPWWNPAVERQAMDRAHRIGQDKPVFVHRLIAENTVETAIQDMQARKQALADALFEGTGDGPLALTEADLTGLFEAR